MPAIATAAGAAPPSNQLPPAEEVSIPIRIAGRYLGDVVVRPVTGEADRAAVIEQRPEPQLTGSALRSLFSSRA